ncbi:MAG: hypothetical protein PQJ61_14135 [Spirochaetales bacterium]|uniref:Outer membrane protein beta-barrel domain-containing protein n=1 Tax=Candidatus Thalassospirochaeta sargassi TaxID=3119039 RepID=A0AAJ1IKX7_9SPIO|nr:hypothetical protein [Spirochaetales bacterium]
MKKILILFTAITAFTFLPALQQNAAAEDGAEKTEYRAETGININNGLYFGGGWDPGANGGSVNLIFSREKDRLLLGAGMELGMGYTGFNLLFPLEAGLIILNGENLQISGGAALMPGIIMSRPLPYFLFAAEVHAQLLWFVSDSLSLEFSAGPRFTLSPGYSSNLAELEMIDLVTGIAAGFRL